MKISDNLQSQSIIATLIANLNPKFMLLWVNLIPFDILLMK
jgi:hypothetical protein